MCVKQFGKNKKVIEHGDESGVITVEACTSLMIFIFVFYIIFEMMRVFAVETGCQEVTTNIALDCSMAKLYKCPKSYLDEIQSMSNLEQGDYSCRRYVVADQNINGGISCDEELIETYIDKSSYLYKLVKEDRVRIYWIDVGWSSDYVSVQTFYVYRLFNVPFLDETPLKMNMEVISTTKMWENR